jgi:hypothetical protein
VAQSRAGRSCAFLSGRRESSCRRCHPNANRSSRVAAPDCPPLARAAPFRRSNRPHSSRPSRRGLSRCDALTGKTTCSPRRPPTSDKTQRMPVRRAASMSRPQAPREPPAAPTRGRGQIVAIGVAAAGRLRRCTGALRRRLQAQRLPVRPPRPCGERRRRPLRRRRRLRHGLCIACHIRCAVRHTADGTREDGLERNAYRGSTRQEIWLCLQHWPKEVRRAVAAHLERVASPHEHAKRGR